MAHWLIKSYWGSIIGREDKWVLMDKKSGIYLLKHVWIPIRRHILVQGYASPDNPSLKEYWHKRQANKTHSMISKVREKLYKTPKWVCVLCKQALDNEEPVHVHHIIPKSQGGDNTLKNLVPIHAVCHRQIHSKQGDLAAVSRLLEPYAE